MVKARLYLYNIGKPSIQTVMAVIISKRVWVIHLVQSNLEDTAPNHEYDRIRQSDMKYHSITLRTV